MTETDGTFWLPPQGSALAADVDWNWNLVYWLSAFFLFLVTALIVLFVLRYRSRGGHRAQDSASHNTPLEVMWSVIPTLLVVVLFWNGYKTYLDTATPPGSAYEVQVTAQKWNWQFTYPNGYVDKDLHVPSGTPVVLVMSSLDVIHSLYLPVFRVKRDVVPGRYSKLWFNALRPGTHEIFCAEYCGRSHSTMLANVVVHEPEEFDAWLADASNFLQRMSPAEAGALLYVQRGCKQCHSLDGSVGSGPSFLGLAGSEQPLREGGTVVADEDYLRESILAPQAKIVRGFDPVMPSYQGRIKDEEISAILAFLKTLSE